MKRLSGCLLLLLAAAHAAAQTQLFSLHHGASLNVAEGECVLRFILSKAPETDAAHYSELKIPVTLFNQAGKVLAEETLVIHDWQVSPLAPEYDLSIAIEASCTEPHMLKLGRVTAAVDGVNREITVHAADFMPVIIK